MVVRPAMMYGLKTVAQTKKREVVPEVAELNIFIRSEKNGQD